MMHRRDLLLQEGSYLLRLQTTLTSRAAAIDAKKCYWNYSSQTAQQISAPTGDLEPSTFASGGIHA